MRRSLPDRGCNFPEIRYERCVHVLRDSERGAGARMKDTEFRVLQKYVIRPNEDGVPEVCYTRYHLQWRPHMGDWQNVPVVYENESEDGEA
jgi:hypothetical protein